MTNNPDKEASAETPTTSTDNKHQKPSPVLRSELQIPNSVINEHKTDKQENNNGRGQLRTWLEVLTLLAIVSYTTIAAYQLGEMRKSTDATKISADAAKRAATVAENTFN